MATARSFGSGATAVRPEAATVRRVMCSLGGRWIPTVTPIVVAAPTIKAPVGIASRFHNDERLGGSPVGAADVRVVELSSTKTTVEISATRLLRSLAKQLRNSV